MINEYMSRFSEARWDELCALVRIKGMRISSKDFTTSELRFIIDETPMSVNEREGAIRYYIGHVSQKQIALDFNYSDSTIKYHKKKVSRALRETCCRIFK